MNRIISCGSAPETALLLHRKFSAEERAKTPFEGESRWASSLKRKCRLAPATVADLRCSKASPYDFRHGRFFHKADPRKRFEISPRPIVDVKNQKHPGVERTLLILFWRDFSRLLLPIGGHVQEILRRPPPGSALRSQTRPSPPKNPALAPRLSPHPSSKK